MASQTDQLKKEQTLQPNSGAATTSLVLGILSLLPCLGGILGIIGLGCGVYARCNGNRGGVSMTGLVLNLTGIALSIFLSVWFYSAIAA